MTDRESPIQDFDAIFAPYAMEIGFLLREWNVLHEGLAMIFDWLLSKDSSGTPLMVWRAVSVERYQRAMLKAAAQGVLRSDKSILEDILALIKDIDKISEKRDMIVHSPLGMGFEDGSKNRMFVPLTMAPFSNKRAEQLKTKMGTANLLDEIRAYRHEIQILTKYTFNLHSYLCFRPSQLCPKPTRPSSSPSAREGKKER